MWVVAVFLLPCLHLTSGTPTIPEHKGCFSTKFVNQYSSYYKINQSLTIEQCIAACNHRLTRYMGLQVDKRFSVNNFVYCGNDLAEVSLKLDNSNCSICQENATLSCGGMNSMSVYMLRESTPLALLLQTNRGVELLIDNIATIAVPYSSSTSHQTVEYIYEDGLILSVQKSGIFRSFYNTTGMQYTKPERFREHDLEPSSSTVDFTAHTVLYSFRGEKKLHDFNMKSLNKFTISGFDDVLEHVSIDPYKRFLAFFTAPYTDIDMYRVTYNDILTHPLKHFKIKKVKALSMDIQERHLYAIVNMINDSSTYLVKVDYAVANMHVLLNSSLLANATVLEVFRDHAVWLRNVSNKSTVFMCKLTPKCLLEHLSSYSSIERIYDFTIYHPEKQTPGIKQLCNHLICPYGCHLFSPFTARCSCPPGMEIDSDNSTCINVIPSTKGSATQATPTTQTPAVVTPPSCVPNTSKANENLGPVINAHEYFIMICVVVNLLLLIGISVLVFYKKVNHSHEVSEQQIELINSYNGNPGNSFLE